MKSRKSKATTPKQTDPLEAAVKEIVLEVTNCEETFLVTDRLNEDLSADSADLIEIVMCLEEKFQVAIGPEEMDKLLTTADLAKSVRIKLNQPQVVEAEGAHV